MVKRQKNLEIEALRYKGHKQPPWLIRSRRTEKKEGHEKAKPVKVITPNNAERGYGPPPSTSSIAKFMDAKSVSNARKGLKKQQ